jgi:3-deoxy-D-manno-octulosonic-acid transferase
MVLITGGCRSVRFAGAASHTISAAGTFDICLAQSKTDAERFAAPAAATSSRRATCSIRRRPGRPAKTPSPAVGDARTARIVARRRIPAKRKSSSKCLTLRVLPSLLCVVARAIPRAAGDRADIAESGRPRRGSREEMPTAVTRHLCRGHARRARTVLSLCADRVHGRIAGRARWTESDPGDRSSAPRSSMVPMCSISPTCREALDGAGRRAQGDAGGSGQQLGQLLADPAARDTMAAAGGVSQLGGALERTPRLSPICCSCDSRWEPRMREPTFWHRRRRKIASAQGSAPLGGWRRGDCSARARRRHPVLRRQLSSGRRRQELQRCSRRQAVRELGEPRSC